MHAEVFTIRDLEEVRRRNRLRKRDRVAAELRAHLLAFVLLAACWLARELLTS